MSFFVPIAMIIASVSVPGIASAIDFWHFLENVSVSASLPVFLLFSS